MKRLLRLIFGYKTEWVPIKTYANDGLEYMVFTRKNLINGILEFKTKKIITTPSRENLIPDFIPTDRVLESVIKTYPPLIIKNQRPLLTFKEIKKMMENVG